MATSIRVISTSTVCAANHKEPNPRIDLTPWDLQLLLQDGIQKGLVFHKPKPDHDPHHENLVQHLQTSLSRTLDFFLPLAGRLATVEHEDETTSFFIDCNNTGAEFVHAIADGVSVSDIIEQTYVPEHIVYSFFPLNGIRNYEGTSNPLLAVQVTELVDCIFIGCTINHTALDGTSFWHFFNSWSEISRGLDSLSKPPVLETDSPIRIPLFKKEQLHSKCAAPPPLQQRVFHFTAESIAELKTKANVEIGTHKISSLQALLSHFWRSAVRIKRLDPDQETCFMILIGVRERLQPPLPQQYLGNAVQAGFITMKAGEVLEQGLGYVALQMNTMIAMHTEEKFRSYLESWIENPKIFAPGSLCRSNGFGASSSPRHNVYGTDFGWGRPIAVRSGPGNKSEGKITIFPGAKQGSVDIEACLSPELLQAMGDDATRSAVRNKQLDPDQETIFEIVIGVRSRLHPPLPQQYLGNAIQGANITMKAGEVLEQGLGYVALKMNETVAMHTEEKLRNHLESWRENPKIPTVLDRPSNCFLLGSSPRHDVYGNDFGWGRPITVRRGPGNKFDGLIIIFPGAEEGSVDIEACLSPETLQGMGNDAEFMDVVTDL